MSKEKDEVSVETSEKLDEILKKYVDEIDGLVNAKRLSIEVLEEKWCGLVETTKLIYKDVNAKIIGGIDERQLIQEKKRIRRERGVAQKR